jgi:hypothetical protein
VVAFADTSTIAAGLVWGFVYGIPISGIPMLVVAHLLKTGRVSDLHLRNKGERNLPYIIAIFGALCATLVVLLFDGPSLLFSLLLCNLFGLAALGVINVYWLISNHAASIALAAGFLGIALGPAVGLALLPLVLATLWARLILNRHTVAQLVAGLVVGVSPVLLFASLGLIG